MKASPTFIVCLLVLIISLFHLSTAVPTKTLGQHVHYVDDRTVSHYIDNPRLVTYLYIYSHSFVCVKCSQAGELVSRAAKEFNGQIYVIAMDAADQYNAETMKRLEIDSATTQFPLVLEFPVEMHPNGADVPILTMDFALMKKRVIDLIGLQSTVKHMDSTNMKKYLSFKTSPKPKAILLTTKAVTPTIWSSLSSQLSHQFDFYMGLKTDRKLIKKLDIDTFPAILIFRKTEFNQDTPDDEIEPIVFNGQMKASVIKAFLSLYIPIDEAQELQPVQYYKQLLDQTHDFVPVLSDVGCFQAYCSPQHMSTQSGLCVLYITPAIHTESLDWSKLQEMTYQFEVLKSVQELHLDHHLNWGIVNGNILQSDAATAATDATDADAFTGVLPTFYQTFSLQQQDYPQVILYNPRKNGFSTFLGAFNPDNLHKWIGEMVLGHASMTSLPSSTTDQTISATFPTVTPTRCKNIYDKRQQEATDLKKWEDSRKKASQKGTSTVQSQNEQVHVNTHGENVDGKDVWSKPYRPYGKKGEVREMTDELWENVFVKRSIGALLHFIDHPTTILTKDASHDINTFKQTIEGLNGMVEGYFVQCTDKSTHVRSLFGIETCDGLIIGLKPRLVVTTELYDKSIIEQAHVSDHLIFITTPEDVESSTVTFKTETLNKWSSKELYSLVNVARLGHESDSLQTWLLNSISEPRVLIFSKKDDIILAKALAMEFYGFAQVAIVGPDNDSLIHQFQVESFPAVRLVKPVVSPRAGALQGEMEMKLELIPIQKQQLYYNAIASHLDHLVSIRFVGSNKTPGSIFEPIHKETPMETVAREMDKAKKAAHREEL